MDRTEINLANINRKGIGTKIIICFCFYINVDLTVKIYLFFPESINYEYLSAFFYLCLLVNNLDWFRTSLVNIYIWPP